MRVTASDPSGISEIQLQLSGATLKSVSFPDTPTTAQAQIDWDTTWVGDCTCDITIVVVSKSGERAEKTVRNVTIFNDDPPPAPPGYPAVKLRPPHPIPEKPTTVSYLSDEMVPGKGYAPGEILFTWRPGTKSGTKAAVVARLESALGVRIGWTNVCLTQNPVCYDWRNLVSPDIWNKTLDMAGPEVSSDALEEAFFGRMYTLSLPDEAPLNAALALLAAESKVASAMPSFYCSIRLGSLPNDPYLDSEADGYQWTLYRTRITDAWEAGYGYGSTSQKIAILDTRCDWNHPDLQDKYIDGWGFGPFPSDNPDANENEPLWSDCRGHGTRVAGVAAAVTNDAYGMAGMAWNSKIMPLRVQGPTLGGNLGAGDRLDSIIAGLRWAFNHGANVVNMSIGLSDATGFDDDMREAVRLQLGELYSSFHTIRPPMTLVACAGNYIPDHPQLPPYLTDPTIWYPAQWWTVIAVGNSNYDDERTETTTDASCYVGPNLTVMAPSVDITSAYDPTGQLQENGDDVLLEDGYHVRQTDGGTSQAAPQVAALCAILRDRFPGMMAGNDRDRIADTAEDIGDEGFDEETAWGRIDAYAALQATTHQFTYDFQSSYPTTRMFTLPYFPLSPSVTQVFGTSNPGMVYRWQVVSQTMEDEEDGPLVGDPVFGNVQSLYPAIEQLGPGRSYWGTFSSAKSVSVQGAEPGLKLALPWRVRCDAGWNMIGNPFDQHIHWNLTDVEILDIRDPNAADDDNHKRTLEEDLAADDPMLDNQTLKGWNGSAYYYLYPQYTDDANNLINPLEGYWVKVTRSCEIIFKAP